MSIARFTDRGVFVTGAGSGLGRATARLFAAEGARVFGVDVSADGVAETVEAVRAASGTADGAVCDVANEAPCTRRSDAPSRRPAGSTCS